MGRVMYVCLLHTKFWVVGYMMRKTEIKLWNIQCLFLPRRMEEENIKKQQYANGQNVKDESMTSNDIGQSDGFVCNNNRKTKAAAPQIRLLHELRAETFNGMVRMLKPGCRSIIVLVDAQSKSKLLPEFHRIVWPYRKYVLKIIISLFLYIKKYRV